MRYSEEELLNGGDWACAWSYHETLAFVCQQLAARLDNPDYARRARRIATLTEMDMLEATRQWGILSTELRERRPVRREDLRRAAGTSQF